jgi:hypothetical protein
MSDRQAPIGGRYFCRFLWVWVGAAMLAYLYQFRSLVDPVLKVMGFK